MSIYSLISRYSITVTIQLDLMQVTSRRYTANLLLRAF